MDIYDDKEYVLSKFKNNDVSKKDYIEYKWISDRLQDDKDVALVAFEYDGWYLSRASDRLRDDKDVVLVAIKNCFTSFEDASERLKNDKDVVFASVSNIKDEYFADVNDLFYYIKTIPEKFRYQDDILDLFSNYLINHKELDYYKELANYFDDGKVLLDLLQKIREKELKDKLLIKDNVENKGRKKI